MSTNQGIPVVPDEKGSLTGHESQVEDILPEALYLDLTNFDGDASGEDFQSVLNPNSEGDRMADESPPLRPIKQRRPTRHAHFRHSTSVVSALRNEWEEYIHPNGSLYWACSTDLVRVVSDIQPPLSKIQPSALSIISDLMAALDEIPQIHDYQNWEIYTDGLSCVYIHHGSRSASETAQSLDEFKSQIGRLEDNLDIETKLRLETAYWAYMQAHPNHRELPEGALDDATEALVWCHADRVLFRTSNAPFSKEDAQEMTELIKTIRDLKRPILKTWYCAAVMRAIAENRLASHYGQNDAREVRRRERSEDLNMTLPFKSWLHRFMWHFIALVCLGTPFGYLKRISTVDRTMIGDGVNTLRWRSFLRSLCKDWQDSNLLATVLVSATVALLAIPGLSGIAQISGIISSLCAISSTMCGMLLVSNHQDHLDGSGGEAVAYFKEVKRRGTGTTRPLAVIIGLPASLMLWGMFWFIFSIASYAWSNSLPGIVYQFSIATRTLSFLILGTLVLIGTTLLAFFYRFWNVQSLEAEKPPNTDYSSTAANMVNNQGGNPLMELSGNQPSKHLSNAPMRAHPVPGSRRHNYSQVHGVVEHDWQEGETVARRGWWGWLKWRKSARISPGEQLDEVGLGVFGRVP